MVYVISKDGHPLMPTTRHGKVKHLLRSGKAKVVNRCPFTIQLMYEANGYTQPITLGVDAGSKTIGLSASTDKKELLAAEVILRNDIVDLLSTRREFRKTRRNRKTRYRKPRFNNRIKTKHKGWLAPSIEQKINTHLTAVRKVMEILPVTKIVIETASFDIQKIKDPDVEGIGYQHGDQLGFWNVREYVFFRDGHTCQCCKGKSKDKILNVHHIESRKTGGDAPSNLITLCEICHAGYHKGMIELPKTIKRGTKFNDATFMGIMRWTFYNRLKEQYPDMVYMTYGYITKNTRIRNELPKTHMVDALCIADHPTAERINEHYAIKKVRCHNRQIHKATINKGGYRKKNQASKYVFGYQLFDKIKYNNIECFIFGRRTRGSFDIRMLDGAKVSTDVSCKKLKLLTKRKSYLIERRSV